MKFLVINGPNLNMLGKRETNIYGQFSLDDLEEWLKNEAGAASEIDFFQSNVEGELVGKIQTSSDYDGLIINAGAFTHTSVAIRDALLSVSSRFVEVHISNVYKREDFRHKSYLSDIAEGVIVGTGKHGYLFALQYLQKENKN